MILKDIKILCFDIDGVICKTFKGNYSASKPIRKNIKLINQLYKKGYVIKLFTARYMGRTKDKKYLAEKKAKKLTTMQLNKWGVCYHKLFFGKVSYDILVDDKAIFFKKDWQKFLNKKLI